MTVKKTMTVKEVCRRCNFSHDTLRRRIAEGYIKPLPKTNPALLREPLRFDPADIERLLTVAAQRRLAVETAMGLCPAAPRPHAPTEEAGG